MSSNQFDVSDSDFPALLPPSAAAPSPQEIEADTLELQHCCFRITAGGRLYTAPVSPGNVRRALDIGTGTGTWAVEWAEEHADAAILGTDVIPVAPPRVPPNCRFDMHDVNTDWNFLHPFDLIHARSMVAIVKDWARFFAQAYANMKTNGWLELQELVFPTCSTSEDATPDTSPTLRWSSLFVEASTRVGIDLTAPRDFVAPLRAAGFQNVHVRRYKWSIGRWARGEKQAFLGEATLGEFLSLLPQGAQLFCRVLGWRRNDADRLVADVRQELEDARGHFYLPVHFWYARKPALDEPSRAASDVTDMDEPLEDITSSQSSGNEPDRQENGEERTEESEEATQRPMPSASISEVEAEAAAQIHSGAWQPPVHAPLLSATDFVAALGGSSLFRGGPPIAPSSPAPQPPQSTEPAEPTEATASAQVRLPRSLNDFSMALGPAPLLRRVQSNVDRSDDGEDADAERWS